LKREVRKLNRALQQKTREADAALPAISANAAMGSHHSDASTPRND
jgi:hypothetical protein